jgi:hypothetical protein
MCPFQFREFDPSAAGSGRHCLQAALANTPQPFRDTASTLCATLAPYF